MTDLEPLEPPKSRGPRSVVMGAVLTGLIVVLLVVVLLRLVSLQNSLTANVNAQVGNRVTNVKHWCNGINRIIDYDRAFVGQFAALSPSSARSLFPAYTLTDLPCKMIETATARSAQH